MQRGEPAEATHDVQTMLRLVVGATRVTLDPIHARTHARTRTHTYTHRWDLGAMGLYTCIPDGDTAPRKCNGPADTTSCPGAGSTPCRENSAKKTLTPFKICYQVRAGLDSCHICT